MRRFACTLATLFIAAAVWSMAWADEPPQRPQRGPGQTPGVYKAQIVPHWFANNTRFWYRNDLRGGAREFILVDAERGTRGVAFDHEKLAGALSKAAEKEYRSTRLPFDSIEFAEENSVRFKIGSDAWKCDLASYECACRGKPNGGGGR